MNNEEMNAVAAKAFDELRKQLDKIAKGVTIDDARSVMDERMDRQVAYARMDKASVRVALLINYRNLSPWRSMEDGYKLAIGDTPTRFFPQKKDGSFNYAKIADYINERMQTEVIKANRKAELEAGKSAAQTHVDELKAMFGLTKYDDTFKASQTHGGPGHYYEHAAQPGKVYLSLNTMEVTPDQARDIYMLLQEMGIKK